MLMSSVTVYNFFNHLNTFFKWNFLSAKNGTRSVDSLKRTSWCVDKSWYNFGVLSEHEYQSKQINFYLFGFPLSSIHKLWGRYLIFSHRLSWFKPYFLIVLFAKIALSKNCKWKKYSDLILHCQEFLPPLFFFFEDELNWIHRIFFFKAHPSIMPVPKIGIVSL